MCKNAKAVLEAAGSGLEKVVKVNVCNSSFALLSLLSTCGWKWCTGMGYVERNKEIEGLTKVDLLHQFGRFH